MKHHLAYSDFWPSFKDSLFEHIVQEQGLTYSEDFHQAKCLLYANLGSRHQAFHGIKIFYSAESILPPWQECDYAIGFMKNNVLYPDCYLRLPYWVAAHYKSPQSMFEAVECTPALRNRPFCSFVNSNPHNTLRNKFYLALSQYKPIASGGSEYNNVGGTIEDKIAFCSNYKFNIAFENYSSRGYLTEKLFDAFAAQTVPIYWGEPSLLEDINPARLINASDFPNLPALIEYIKEVDNNDTLYASYLNQTVFLPKHKKREDYINDLRQFLKKILTNGKIERKYRLLRDNYPMMPSYKNFF